MFFQAFKNEITTLPEPLIDSLKFVPELLTESKSSGTVNNYYHGFLRWKKWAQTNGIKEDDILPAKDLHVALYLASLVQLSRTPSPVIQAFYSIRWAHCVVSVISPTESFLVKNILEGAKRRLCVPTVKKEPVTPELLQKMYDSLFCVKNVYNQRTICACLLAYAGFMRISELLNLRICDINFSQEYVSVFIEKSKTDVYRDGNWLIICRTGSSLCPVRNLELYLEWLGCCKNSECYLFQNLVKVQQGYIFRQVNKSLSYSRMRELFIEAFSPFVVNIKSYGLHSLRSGGATSAAKYGVPDRLFKRHGRWRSDKSKDGYVKDDLVQRMLVSQNLGI